MSIYFIRHAQSALNAVHDPNKPDPMIIDVPITEPGETQAKQAREGIEKLDLKDVIVSPFTRTLQRAQLILKIDCLLKLTRQCESNSATAAM